MKKPAAKKPEGKKKEMNKIKDSDPKPKLTGKSNLEIDLNADMVIGNAASQKGVDDQTKEILAAVASSAQSLSETEA